MKPRGASRSGRRAVALTVRMCVWLGAALMAACTSTNSLNVQTRGSRVPIHVVQPGETLYQIAWQYRLDQRDLVRWNGLRNPDLLSVGQRLRLAPARRYPAAAPTPSVARQAPPPPPRASPAPAPPARRPAVQRPPSAPAAAGTSAPPAAALPPAWQWPTEGQLVTRFGSTTGIATGIAIRGREGQPVRAAEAGHVVYAGSGLIGYGQLVIVKHDETYLSAYGHNSRLLVTQGQAVGRGATIALMGQGPERQPRLHFEIRRDGVPVDPLLYLPPLR